MEERIRPYEKAMGLFKDGMRRGEIVRVMQKRFGLRLAHSTVVDWTEKGSSPYGRVHRFESVATPELAYVIGVKLGDATQSKGTWQHSYMIKLVVVDKEFATEFSRCASVVLRCKPFKVWWYSRRRAWCTTVSSIMLYKFLLGGLPKFKAFADHCVDYAASFLRGFLDSEAGVSETEPTVSNGNRETLTFVQYLLSKYFQIKTTGPHERGPPPGTKKEIKGRLVTVNMQDHLIRVRTKSLKKLEHSVGFTIVRKRAVLHRLVNRGRVRDQR